MRPKKLSWFNQEIIFLILVIIFSNFIMFCRGGSDNNIFWIQGYAGNGYVGYSNYNSTDATSALIGQPYNVWMNSNGDIFFPDSINHRISKISGGIISTVVGTAWGSGGFTSNTAKALYSRLNSPQSVWGDTKGNLYIADTSNHRIRFFNISSGILSSVAGTGTGASSPDNRPALNITLNSPSGVFGDTNGNIFLTDTNNYRVRKVAAGTSIITTIMGNGTSGFAGDGSSIAISSMVKSPTGLFLDTNGNLYIADKSNNRVRMISSAGVFSTVAGTGSGGSTGDNGPATSAKINNPNCIWVDSLGNIFISDTNGNKIRRVSAGTNIITTYAGTGTVGYNGEMKLANITMLAAPYGVWGDTTGAIIVADRLNRRIRKISYPQRTFSLVAGTYDIGDGGQVQNAKLYNPYNINSDTTGLVLFITDGGNCRIRKVNLTSSVITTYGGTSTCGLSGDNGPVSSAQISGPRSMYVDSLSNLYFTDSANYRVRKVSSATNIITNIMGSNWGAFAENVTATAAKFQGLSGIWVDSNGHVFVTDSSFNRIVRWNAKSNFVNNFAGTGTGGALGDGGLATLAQLKSPQGLWGDSNLKLFIVDSGNYKIRVLNLATNIITTFAGVGVSSTLDKVPALNAKFSSPTGIIGDKYGNFYVMDNTRIRLLSKVNDTLWMVSTVIGTGSSGGNNVGGVATLSQIGQTTGLWIDSNYNFYLAETGYNRVRMAYQISNPTGQPSREPTGQPSRQPYSLPTGQPTRAPSGQPTKQPFSLPTGQPSRQPTTQPTSQPTREPTGQPSRQPSSQPTAQPTQSPSRQPTTQPTRDPTGQPTRTPSTQPTSKPSSQPSTQPSSQPTTCPSMQPSVQPTQAPSSQPTSRPTSQPSSPPIAAPSSHPTTQPFSVPSGQPLSQPTRIPSAQPFGFPSSQPSTQPSANPSTQPTSQPSKGPSSQPSCQPSSFPSTQPTAQPSSHPSSPPSRLPSTKPSKSPSCQPTVLPTAQPSNQPSVLPTTHPTSHPSTMSSSQPTSRPSAPPSAQPFTRPTSEPSSLPSVLPTTLPTRQPTSSPSSHPSNNPTPSPSGFPTTQPTSYPSQIPSTIPTMKPSNLPTANPTSQPSLKPSLIPTCRPSCLPTSFPSNYPSGQPTGFPTTLPSAAPTDFPTIIPSSTPTSWPTVCPSAKPTILPTTIPTISPVSQPSHAPLAVPTALPSTVPSLMPSMYPIGFPSGQPTPFPVVLPRIPPSVKPTTLPSGSLLTQPSICPTSLPSYTPIALPTGQPAMNPSTTPSSTPIDIPTSRPTTLSSYFIIKSSSPSPACSPSVALTFPPSPFSAQPTSLFHLPSHLPTELPVCWSPSLIPSGMPISLYPSYSPSTALPTRPIQSSTRPSLTPSLRPSTGNPSRSPTLSPSLYPTVESSSSNDTLPFDFLSSAIIMPDGYSRFQQVLFLFSPLSRDSNVYKNINVPAPSLGNSFVVFGTTDPVRAFTNISLWSDETQTEFVTVGAGLSIEGSQRAVSLLGDINHDNHEDFVIGNPFQNEVYVVLGSQTKVKYGFTVRGEVAGDNLGWSVSSAGDFNGDGFRDVLVSAWQSGRCYVIYGKASGFKDVWLSTLESVDGLRIIGGNDTSNLGIAVSGAGDFNGDGRDDILLTGRGPLGDNVVYLVYGMKNGGSRVSLDLNGLTTQMGLRIKAPRFSFAGLSLAGVGDVNGDGYADVCIGSVPYKNGYSRQESYIVYGNRSEVNVDMYLEDLISIKRGRKIEGGGIVVMGAGDVDGDEIDDILVINYDDWASSPGSFIITVPNHGVSRHPTLFPSSHPSVSTPQPSNFPSSSPSQRVVVIVPTLSTNDTRTPTILKTTRPSLFPTLRPTRKPSSMTQNPSPVPTIATNTPSLAPSSIRPSIKPSRSPTASPSVNRQPTSVPSSSPTLSMSQPWVTTEITSGGFYVGSHRREVFVVDSEGNVVIRGIEGGRSIYKILPRANVTITILNFHNNQDIIDLSEFSSLTWLGDLSYQTYPLVLLLGSAKDQTVVLSSHNEFDLSDSNFIFNQNGNSNRGDTSAGSSSSSVSLSSISFNAEVISFFGVIGGLVLLSFCFCHAITHIERVGKTKKAARLKARISQSLHTLPDENTRELSNLQSPLSPILEGQGEDSPAARSIFLQFSSSTRMPSKASNSHSSSSASSNSMNSGASSGHGQEESVSDSVDGSSSSNQEDNDDEEDEEDVDESQSSYASFSSFDSFEQA